MSKEEDEMFEQIYYDPSNPAAFGGVARLSKAVNGKDPRKWLEGQPAYTLHKPARKRVTRQDLTEQKVLTITGRQI